MSASFQGSSFKKKNLKNYPFSHFNPPSTKGSGYLFWAILQKSLMIGQFACMQIFWTLASKWRISKNTPIAYLTPH